MAALAMAGYWFRQYQNICQNLPDLKSLESENQRQEAQLEVFAKTLATFKDQMSHLKDFNRKLRVLANLDKPAAEDSIFGVGGPDGHGAGPGVRLATTNHERRILTMRRELDHLSAEGEAQRLVQVELAKFLKERRSILASTPSMWPTHGWVTSGYGYRVSPFTGKRTFHSGLDISTRSGTLVRAPANGVVTFAGWEGGFGRLLVVNHGHGMVTRYAHLRAFKVKVGDRVERNQLLGLVGSSGRTTGPHLHYEILLSGVPTNPRAYILD
ncbi:MAG: M23 family metallopeptidase [Deltaproteobacteria bacterium]|nr:M23 family metallopeptidase [Deltaproteobacteria bacterium]